MNNYRIAFGLCLLACSFYLQDAQASSWVTEKLEARTNDEAEQLAPELEKLNTHLVSDLQSKVWKAGTKLVDKMIKNSLLKPGAQLRLQPMKPSEPKVEKIFEAVERLYRSHNLKHGEDLEKNQALDKLISIKSSAFNCNLQNLEGFVKLISAMYKCQQFPDHISTLVQHYRWKHAAVCGSTYKQNYDRFVESLKEDEQLRHDFERVHAALDELDISDIGKPLGPPNFYWPSKQRSNMFKMPAFMFGQDNLKAADKIALQIGKQLVRDQQWDSKSLDDAHLKKALDEYLFRPCARFRHRSRDVLQPALLLAEYAHYEFGFTDDLQYFRTVLDFGLCEKLLDEREQLYAKFSQLLRNTLPDQRLATADRV